MKQRCIFCKRFYKNIKDDFNEVYGKIRISYCKFSQPNYIHIDEDSLEENKCEYFEELESDEFEIMYKALLIFGYKLEE